jgi:hypothetical protein
MAIFKPLTTLANAPPQPNPRADVPFPIVKSTAKPTTPESDEETKSQQQSLAPTGNSITGSRANGNNSIGHIILNALKGCTYRILTSTYTGLYLALIIIFLLLSTLIQLVEELEEQKLRAEVAEMLLKLSKFNGLLKQAEAMGGQLVKEMKGEK